MSRDTIIDDQPAYFSPFQPKNLSTIPTITDSIIIFYDPAKTQFNEKRHLGNLGSAVYTPLVTPRKQLGIQLGGSPYDDYRFDIQDFKFLQIKAGYTDLNFSLTGQVNAAFNALFSRNFSKDRLNFVFRYHRISQEGQYQRQTNKNTLLSTGAYWSSKNKKLRSAWMFNSNLITQADNGGIRPDADLLTAASQIRNNIPIIFQNHVTKDHNLQYALYNQYRLSSLQQSNVYVFNLTQYDRMSYLHEDRRPDSLIHRDYFLGRDSLRLQLKNNKWKTEFGVGITTKGQNPINIRSSLVLQSSHIVDRLYQDRITELISNNYISFALGQKLGIRANLKANLSGAGSEFYLDGKLHYQQKEKWLLLTQVIASTQQPLYTQNNIVLNDRLLSESKLANQKYFIVNGLLSYLPWKLRINYRSSLLRDYIYWNTDRKPQQFDKALTLQEIDLRFQTKWKFLSLESSVKYRIISHPDILRIPQFEVSELIYVDSRLFKNNLQFKTGFHLRMLGPYQALAYYPTLGIFYNSDQSGYQSYPDISYFVEFRISRFKLFILMQNLYNYQSILPEIEIDRYPQFDQRMRIGFRWIFRN